MMRHRRPKEYSLQLDRLLGSYLVEHSRQVVPLSLTLVCEARLFASLSTLGMVQMIRVGSSEVATQPNLYPSISTALLRPRRPKQHCLQLQIILYITSVFHRHQIWKTVLPKANTLFLLRVRRISEKKKTGIFRRCCIYMQLLVTHAMACISSYKYHLVIILYQRVAQETEISTLTVY